MGQSRFLGPCMKWTIFSAIFHSAILNKKSERRKRDENKLIRILNANATCCDAIDLFFRIKYYKNPYIFVSSIALVQKMSGYQFYFLLWELLPVRRAISPSTLSQALEKIFPCVSLERFSAGTPVLWLTCLSIRLA